MDCGKLKANGTRIETMKPETDLQYAEGLTDKELLDPEAVRSIYQVTAFAYKALFGQVPRHDIEQRLSDAWDRHNCESAEDYDRFYCHNQLVTEEVAVWHQERRGQRVRRVIHSGNIANQLGMKSFCEVGAGIGTDGIALTKLGFECKYLAEINRHSLKMIERLANFALSEPITIVDLGKTVKEHAQRHFGPVDWLYSSDVFEHIFDLERWLDPWIRSFKLVTVYAPFGKSDKNHAHTDYSKVQFNRFMDAQGFDKLRIRGLGIPPMVYRRRL